jgi:hypothetical protein
LKYAHNLLHPAKNQTLDKKQKPRKRASFAANVRFITGIFSTDKSLGIIGVVSGAPEGVRHTLPAKNFGQRPIMPVLAAVPLPEFAGAAVLIYDNHTLPLRLNHIQSLQRPYAAFNTKGF